MIAYESDDKANDHEVNYTVDVQIEIEELLSTVEDNDHNERSSQSDRRTSGTYIDGQTTKENHEREICQTWHEYVLRLLMILQDIEVEPEPTILPEDAEVLLGVARKTRLELTESLKSQLMLKTMMQNIVKQRDGLAAEVKDIAVKLKSVQVKELDQVHEAYAGMKKQLDECQEHRQKVATEYPDSTQTTTSDTDKFHEIKSNLRKLKKTFWIVINTERRSPHSLTRKHISLSKPQETTNAGQINTRL